ncbi:MAG: hypothetical protein CM15mP87_01410 [Candidatus Neomarinimicrobiota bacterium]|nr:MAG: hypothetical protein CM15mP87_01410 [Candidatus Neomarinimicrobiota bacterium]
MGKKGDKNRRKPGTPKPPKKCPHMGFSPKRPGDKEKLGETCADRGNFPLLPIRSANGCFQREGHRTGRRDRGKKKHPPTQRGWTFFPLSAPFPSIIQTKKPQIEGLGGQKRKPDPGKGFWGPNLRKRFDLKNDVYLL